MKLSERMINHLEKFGEYDTPSYRYFISGHNGKEYVSRYPIRRYGNDIKVIGEAQDVRVWRGESWAIF